MTTPSTSRTNLNFPIQSLGARMPQELVSELTTEQRITHLALEVRNLLLTNQSYEKCFEFTAKMNEHDIRLGDLLSFAFDNELEFNTSPEAITAIINFFGRTPEADVREILKEYSRELRTTERNKDAVVIEAQTTLRKSFARSLSDLCKEKNLDYMTQLRALKEARENPTWLFNLLQNKSLLGESFTSITCTYLLKDRIFDSEDAKRKAASQIAYRTRKALKDLGVIRIHSDRKREIISTAVSSQLFRGLFIDAGIKIEGF